MAQISSVGVPLVGQIFQITSQDNSETSAASSRGDLFQYWIQRLLPAERRLGTKEHSGIPIPTSNVLRLKCTPTARGGDYILTFPHSSPPAEFRDTNKDFE